MRKIYTLLAMVCITGMVMAQRAHIPVDCNYTEDGIGVDGVVDVEWDNADELTMEIQGGDDLDFTLYSASFRILWNDTCLFMLCQIDDDDHCDQWCTEQDDWLSDRLEIFIDTGDPLDDGGGAMESVNPLMRHRQCTGFWFEEVTDTAWLNTSMWYHNTPYWSAFSLDVDYFDYEFGFIWDEMWSIDSVPDPDDTLMFVAQNDAQIGLNVVMVDVDLATKENRAFANWAEGSGWDCMDSMGVVTLIGRGTAVKNVTASQSINVYPTPANDVLYIDAEAGVEVRINNIIGQEVLRIRNYNGNPVDLSGFSTGLYYVSVYNNDGALLGKNKFSVVR
jgi:hypothetical protein